MKLLDALKLKKKLSSFTKYLDALLKTIKIILVCSLFQARIAFLQGERKGQENLKRDLIRRIKMLEYALKQERCCCLCCSYCCDTLTYRRERVAVRTSASQSVNLGFIPVVESYQKTKKWYSLLLCLALSIKKGNSVQNKPASLLVVFSGKALHEMPPLLCGRQVVYSYFTGLQL